MSAKNYNVIGVMSGTSLDGIDLAHINFRFENDNWDYQLLECETIPYPEEWIEAFKEAVHFDGEALHYLNTDYTQYLGEVVRDFIERNDLNEVEFICSHGHTILHQPQKGITLQIGNLPEIAHYLGKPVFCDFRVHDVWLGGQGAPLVPIGDRILFSDYQYCLNLGGFSNVSFEIENHRIAFDISPVNTVLNHYAEALGKPYDEGGKWAEKGTIIPELLEELNRLDYYKRSFPKSLGIEFVHHQVLPITEKFSDQPQNILRTFCEHIGIQTAIALPKATGKMLITGGGAYNNFLISCLRNRLPQLEIVIPDAKTLEYKEALIFGLLGVLKSRGEINVLATVTGASQDHSSGKLYLP